MMGGEKRKRRMRGRKFQKRGGFILKASSLLTRIHSHFN